MGLPSWEEIKEFIVTFGWAKGILTIFFFMAHAWIYSLYNGRLKDRQKEIDRIAYENREYRERFLALLDQHFGFGRPKKKK